MCNCCLPSRSEEESKSGRAPHVLPPPGGEVAKRQRGAAPRGLVAIPAQTFIMGATDELSYPADGEGPLRPVSLPAYRIDACAVSNADFAAFTAATGYRTDSEHIGWSFVFAGLLPDNFPPTRAAADAPWWRQVLHASWHAPEGPGSSIHDRLDHPVVHISWRDAAAYAQWAGKQLPTEAQWECAARGGLPSQPYPWGADLTPHGSHRMNVWQGVFPTQNALADGYYGTCPVDAFPPNAYGLYNPTGNVWEWCRDWFDVFHPPASAAQPLQHPSGPPGGDLKVLKGGSFLCHASYCLRYRPAARLALTPDSATSNTGFRCLQPM